MKTKLLRTLLAAVLAVITSISAITVNAEYATLNASQGYEAPLFMAGEVLITTVPGISGKDTQTYVDTGVFEGISYTSVDVLMDIASEETGAILKINLSKQTKKAVLEAIEILEQNSSIKYAQPNYMYYIDDPISDIHMFQGPKNNELIVADEDCEAEVTFSGRVPAAKEEVITGTSLYFDSNSGSYVIKSGTPIENGVLVITEYEDESYTNAVANESFAVTTVDGIAEVEVVEKYLYKDVKAELFEYDGAEEALCTEYDFIAMTGLYEPELLIRISELDIGNTAVDWRELTIDEYSNVFSYSISLNPGSYRASISGTRVPTPYEVTFSVINESGTVDTLTLTECPADNEVISVGKSGTADVTFAGIVPELKKEIITGTSLSYSNGYVTVKSEAPVENAVLAAVVYNATPGDDITIKNIHTYNVTTVDGTASIDISESSYEYVKFMLWDSISGMKPLCTPITAFVAWTGAKEAELKISIYKEIASSYQLAETQYIVPESDNTFSYIASLEPGEYKAVISGTRVDASRTIYFTVQ